MKRDEIRQALFEVLREIQFCSGQPCVDMCDDTCPMEDLPGFTSLNCVEVSSMLSAKLGYRILPRYILAKSKGKHPTITVLLDRLCPS